MAYMAFKGYEDLVLAYHVLRAIIALKDKNVEGLNIEFPMNVMIGEIDIPSLSGKRSDGIICTSTGKALIELTKSKKHVDEVIKKYEDYGEMPVIVIKYGDLNDDPELNIPQRDIYVLRMG